MQVSYEPQALGQYAYARKMVEARLRVEMRRAAHRVGPGRRNIVNEHRKIVDKYQAQTKRAAAGRYDWT